MRYATPPIELTLISEDRKDEITLKTKNASITFPKHELMTHLDMTLNLNPQTREGAVTPLTLHFQAPDQDNILRRLGTGFWRAFIGRHGDVDLSPDPESVLKHGTDPVLSGIARAKRSVGSIVYGGLTRDNMQDFSSIKQHSPIMIKLPYITGNSQTDVREENEKLSEALSSLGANYVMSGASIFSFDEESNTLKNPLGHRNDLLLGYSVDLLRAIESEPRIDHFKQTLAVTGIPHSLIDQITSGDGAYGVKISPDVVGAFPDEMLPDLANKVRYQLAHKLGNALLVDYQPGSADIASRLEDALSEPLLYLDEKTLGFHAEATLVALGASYGEELKSDCAMLPHDQSFFKSLENLLHRHFIPDPIEPSVRPGMR